MKIDQAHLADRTIREVVTHPAIGRAAARLSFAIHLRTEQSQPVAGDYYPDQANDDEISPVLFEASR